MRPQNPTQGQAKGTDRPFPMAMLPANMLRWLAERGILPPASGPGKTRGTPLNKQVPQAYRPKRQAVVPDLSPPIARGVANYNSSRANAVDPAFVDSFGALLRTRRMEAGGNDPAPIRGGPGKLQPTPLMPQVYQDPNYGPVSGVGSTGAGLRTDSPMSRANRAYVAAYKRRPTHWASPVNLTPNSAVYDRPQLPGKQREIYARTTFGTSINQFQHLYLSTFRPAIFNMPPYYQALKYAITPKRLGTFGVVPIQAQGQALRKWPWQMTKSGFPVAGSWPQGITG